MLVPTTDPGAPARLEVRPPGPFQRGGVLGLALTRFLRTQGLSVTAVPGRQLVMFLVLGAVIGVVAAAFPARRAGRPNVLDAIATD